MPERSRAMKTSSGMVINRKFETISGLDITEDEANVSGKKAVTKIMIKIIIEKAIIRYLNFNVNSPGRIIKERSRYVNLGEKT